jgi:copper chaperone CopZ
MLGAVAILIGLAFAGEASAQCCAPKAGSDTKDANAQCALDSNLVLNIGGMTCRDCAPRVEKALTGIKGVKSAKVSYERGEATLELSTPAPKAKDLLTAVKRAGFTGQVKTAPAAAPGKATNGTTKVASKS